jgi:hypothetical protein
MNTEDTILQSHGLPRDMVIQAMEQQFLGDTDLECLIDKIATLSNRFEVLNDEGIAVEV